MANKKTPGVAKKKVNWKTYLRNTWQLYVMMLIPIIWLICFKYKPMLYIVVAFKKYNIFKIYLSFLNAGIPKAINQIVS